MLSRTSSQICGRWYLPMFLFRDGSSYVKWMFEHFTYEDPKEEGSIPFLDMLITPDEEGRLNTNVYRKPTHTDQYLHRDSHHAITSKYSVIGTLYHWARTVCSNPNQLQNEEKHLFKSLNKCKYPNWSLNRVNIKSQTSAQK